MKLIQFYWDIDKSSLLFPCRDKLGKDQSGKGSCCISHQVTPAGGAVHRRGSLKDFQESPECGAKQEDQGKKEKRFGRTGPGKEERKQTVHSEVDSFVEAGQAEQPFSGEVIAGHQAQEGDHGEPEEGREEAVFYHLY